MTAETVVINPRANNTRSNDLKAFQAERYTAFDATANANVAGNVGVNADANANAAASSSLDVGNKTTEPATERTATATTPPPTTTTSTTTPTATSMELTENFYINTKRKSNVKIQVKLNGDGIYLRRETELNDHVNEQFIRIGDVVGSRCGPRLKKRARGGLSSCRSPQYDEHEQPSAKSGSQQPVKDNSAYLYIYAYVKRDKDASSRNRTVRILRFRSFDRYEYNLKSAQRWHAAIRQHKGLPAMESGEQPRPLLVLLNPKSGSGKARELFQKQAAPVLKEAEAHYDLQITTHANYAREFVRDRRDLLQRYSGIVVASGDGLLYEVVNGLMERPDWQAVCSKMPIGIIPCGSGNGLAKSIAYLYSEPYEPKPIMHAALNCVSGKTAPMDIVRVELFDANGKELEMYSFLAVGWGLLADIDIESERLRSIGPQRFTLWAIHRLISLRTYRGKLYYLPWKAADGKAAVNAQHAGNEGDQTCWTAEQPEKPTQPTAPENTQESNEFHDAAEDDDFFADAISLDGEGSYAPRVDSWHSATSRHTAYYSLAGQSIRSRRSVTASILSKLEAANAEFEARRSTPPPLKSAIPRLNEPIPSDGSWHCEEGEYVLVNSAYTTHLSTDCLFVPEAQLNDGIIHLVIVRAGVSRPQVLSFLLGLSSGTHIPSTPSEFIEVVPVRAYRIEPYVGNETANNSNGGNAIMTVDGERVNYGPIQAEIFPGMFNLMVPNSESCAKK